MPVVLKEYRERTSRTNHLIYINQHIIKEIKTKLKNVAMTWIDYKRNNDTVNLDHGRLKMYEISEKIMNLIKKVIENWKVGLTAR